MRILPLRACSPYLSLKDTNRSLFVAHFQDIQLTGRNIHYPNCLLQTNKMLINPYDERIMSLKKDSFYDNNEWELNQILPKNYLDYPVFFFIYNVDNYFHFVYDTLPILYSYFQLKEKYPSLQLLLQTSHPNKQTLSPFVIEFLNSLSIDSYKMADTDTIYSSVFVSTSFTHGGQSNDPPSSHSFTLWKSLSTQVRENLPKRFYISRRSWIHGKRDNIGTNYTTRRKCMNEDALVTLLKSYGVEEVFSELLTTEQKLAMFQKAELVVGIIGGGMCNLLFSPSQTKALCILTPYFLDINERFKYSMQHTQLKYSVTASLFSYEGKFPLYSRVKVKESGKIGEIEEYKDNQFRVTLSSNDVAGFSQDFPMESKWFSEDALEAVDKGLNSPFEIHLNQLEEDLKTLLYNLEER